MKVVFSVGMPFFLAHGGMQTLTEALMRELARIGLEVEPERWWDEKQSGDVLHYVGRPFTANVRAAHAKGWKVAVTENIGQTAARGKARLLAQRTIKELAQASLPPAFLDRLSWDVYQEADALIYIVEHEWETAQFLFRANPARGHVIAHGLEADEIASLAKPQAEEDYLVSMATIYPVKNTVLLARAAKMAETPIVFLGKPYSTDDPYFREFETLIDNKWVRYPGFATGEEKWRWLRGARGFALLSRFESGCIAAYEAAAAGLPLFLSDLAWANKVYHKIPTTRFAPLSSSEAVARELRLFYSGAHRGSKPTFPVQSWTEVARAYLGVYKGIL
jgi:glycosyltransferase involved in cell wall biosynthesis